MSRPPAARHKMSNLELVNRIDEAVLVAAGERWTKVAMVIARVLDVVGQDLPAGEERFDLIANRIEALVNEGRLVAQGNIHNWRFSEVCQSNTPKTS